MKLLDIRKAARSLESLLAFFAIFLLALIPNLEVIARKFFHTGIRNSTEYTHHLVLILAFIGAAITSRENRHLSLTLNLKFKPETLSRFHLLNAVLSTAFATAFAWCSMSFLLSAFDAGEKLWLIPMRWIVMVMPLGYGVMAYRFARLAPGRTWGKIIASTGFIFGSLLAWGAITTVAQAVFPAGESFFNSLMPLYDWIGLHLSTPLILLILFCALTGMPIFIILGGIAYMLFAHSAQPLEIIANEAYSLLTSHSLPAIPLFTFTGFMLSESKAGQRIVRLFKAIFAWFPGGLGIVAIMVCTFFTTFTGASGVTILAVGGLLSYVLIKGQYGKQFSSGLLTAVGSIGLLFPPSLPVIIYGVTAQVSIKDMFVGGIAPGIILVLAMTLFVVLFAKRHDVPRERFVMKEALAAVKDSFWEILLPAIIILGYFGGITTLVESAAVAVIYSMIAEMVIHRDIKARELANVLLKCMPIIGGVLAILALAKGLSYYIVDAEIPMQLTAWVQSTIHSKYVFLLLLNIALLITGCFMDIFSAIMVVVPLIIPLGNLFGIHPVHLGIIFLANMELGYLTPPVGMNLYLASYTFNEPIGKIYRDVLPFLLIQLAAVLLITYIPLFSTGLLGLFK